MATMAIEAMATLRIHTDCRSMLMATRRVSVSTMGGRTITWAAVTTNRLAAATWVALVVADTAVALVVAGTAVALGVVAMAAVDIADRERCGGINTRSLVLATRRTTSPFMSLRPAFGSPHWPDSE